MLISEYQCESAVRVWLSVLSDRRITAEDAEGGEQGGGSRGRGLRGRQQGAWSSEQGARRLRGEGIGNCQLHIANCKLGRVGGAWRAGRKMLISEYQRESAVRVRLSVLSDRRITAEDAEDGEEGARGLRVEGIAN